MKFTDMMKATTRHKRMIDQNEVWMILGEKLKINKRKCKFVLRHIVVVQWVKTIPPKTEVQMPSLNILDQQCLAKT